MPLGRYLEDLYPGLRVTRPAVREVDAAMIAVRSVRLLVGCDRDVMVSAVSVDNQRRTSVQRGTSRKGSESMSASAHNRATNASADGDNTR